MSEVIKNMGLRKKKWFIYILAEITILGGTYWNGQKQVDWKGMWWNLEWDEIDRWFVSVNYLEGKIQAISSITKWNT